MIQDVAPRLTCDDERSSIVGPTSPHLQRNGPSRVLVGLIHSYQAARSGRPTGCRYIPSCSEYAVEAIDIHGPVRGTALAARRIARCTPWGGHGIDPVPERSTP